MQEFRSFLMPLLMGERDLRILWRLRQTVSAVQRRKIMRFDFAVEDFKVKGKIVQLRLE